MPSKIEFSKYKTRGANYHYDQISKLKLEKFNSFVYARYTINLDLICQQVNKKYNKNEEIKIIDFGCGDGVLLYLLARKLKGYNIKLYGIDSSEEALRIARKKIPDAIFKKTNVYDSTMNKNNFDIVISSDVIEHLNFPEKMLTEINRIAKHDAYILISTPIKNSKRPLDKMHFQEFYQEDLLNLMQKFFRNCKLRETHDLLYFLLYQRQLNILSKKITVYRYLINFLVIVFHLNPFIRKNNLKNRRYSYMFVECNNT